MIEPTVTPMAMSTPNFYLDQIDVAVELPMGPPGTQGPPGTAWLVGSMPGPPSGSDYDEGTLYLGGDGKIWVYNNGRWTYTEVDLIPEAGDTAPHDHFEYLRLTGGAMSGPLVGIDASFTGNVVVPTPDAPTEAVNLEYLTNQITSLNLSKFFGDGFGNAISTGNSWNLAQGQAIYQQTGPVDAPPSITGKTVGLVLRQSTTDLAQFVCDLTNNLWFARTKKAGSWTAWTPLSPIVSSQPPVDPIAGGPPVAHGTIWIQVDSTVM